MGSCWPPFRPKIAQPSHKTIQHVPKTPQDPPKTSQNTPRTSKMAPRPPPELPNSPGRGVNLPPVFDGPLHDALSLCGAPHTPCHPALPPPLHPGLRLPPSHPRPTRAGAGVEGPPRAAFCGARLRPRGGAHLQALQQVLPPPLPVSSHARRGRGAGSAAPMTPRSAWGAAQRTGGRASCSRPRGCVAAATCTARVPLPGRGRGRGRGRGWRDG